MDYLTEIKNKRADELARVHRAIAKGKAYLDTAFDKKYVNGYNFDTGWATTGKDWSRRSFMVCLEDILIED